MSYAISTVGKEDGFGDNNQMQIGPLSVADGARGVPKFPTLSALGIQSLFARP